MANQQTMEDQLSLLAVLPRVARNPIPFSRINDRLCETGADWGGQRVLHALRSLVGAGLAERRMPGEVIYWKRTRDGDAAVARIRQLLQEVPFTQAPRSGGGRTS